MPISYLYNEPREILSISNKLLTFNDIKIILQELPSYVVHQDPRMIERIDDNKETLLDVQKRLLILDHVNINISLDIINQKDKIFYKNFMLYFYNQDVNLNFKNYSMYNILNEYKLIIQKMVQKIKLDQFSFNPDLLFDTPNTLNKLLEIRKENAYISDGLIDVYLKDIENAPESTNDLCNYIYIIRKFPLFRILINNYLNVNENDIYSIIVENELDIIDDDSEILLPILFGFSDDEKIIHNVFSLFKDYSLKDFFYIIQPIDIDINTLYNAYEEIDINQFGINIDNGSINIRKLIDNLYSLPEFDIYLSLTFFFTMNGVSSDILRKISKENLDIIISTFFVNLYTIFVVLRLYEFNIQDMKRLFQDAPRSGMNPEGSILPELLLYIHLSYFTFSYDPNNLLFTVIERNINLLKHFFYIIQYTKNILPNLFPLIIFLSCSNKNLKFIYEYKNNNLLDFMNEYYDIIYENAKKIIIKNPK